MDEVLAFLSGSATFDFELHSREEAYRWIQDTLRRFGYLRLNRPDRGVVKAYLEKVSGLSRAQDKSGRGETMANSFFRWLALAVFTTGPRIDRYFLSLTTNRRRSWSVVNALALTTGCSRGLC